MSLDRTIIALLVFFSLGCNKKDEEKPSMEPVTFGTPQTVTVQGYDDHLMEPFLSRDGSILFFNNLNEPSANTNLHWATKIDKITFQYQGELQGINTNDLEGVPTMDVDQNFYYVYTGEYENTLATIYTGKFNNGSITDIAVVENISKNQIGWLNFDVEVTSDGQHLFFVDGRFDQNGGPYEANLVIASKNNGVFSRLANSAELLQNINTDNLEYAAAISKNQLELYFTKLTLPIGPDSEPQIYLTTRKATSEPFSPPQLISEINGFVEAAAPDANDKGIYYHKKESGKHVLYYIEKQ